MRQLKLWVVRMWIHYFVRLDPKEKCPACGIRQFHPQRYDTRSKTVLNRCSTLHIDEAHGFGCGAIWSSKCLINPAHWEATMRVQDEDGKQDVEQNTSIFVPASREPVKIDASKGRSA